MSFFTADQIVAHMVGDYIIQSDWMANEKTKRSLAAAIHAITYTLPFLFITWNPVALATIAGTHFVIDRWRLARYVIWLKERPWPGSLPLAQMGPTGYPADKPAWLAVWLLIFADNTLHVICNGVAIAMFP
jgi:hypothetical protein